MRFFLFSRRSAALMLMSIVGAPMCAQAQSPQKRPPPPKVKTASVAKSSQFQSQAEMNVAPPADRLLLSAGGVDMRNQQYQFRSVDLSIGGEGAAGLSLVRTSTPIIYGHLNPFGNFSHNLDIMAVESRVAIEQGNFTPGAGQDYQITVRVAGVAETFYAYYDPSVNFTQANKSTFASLTRDPASGTKDSASVSYRYTASDGVVYKFRPLGNRECSDFAGFRCAYVSEIVYPDGTALTLSYDTSTPGQANNARLKTVSSSRGYGMLFEYDGSDWASISKACVFNLAYSQMPSSGSCGNAAEAAVQYAYGNYPNLGNRLASVTDVTGQVWSYGYQAINAYGAFDMSYYKPGQSTPWLINSTATSIVQNEGSREIVYYQQFANGETLTYEFFDAAGATAGGINDFVGGTITSSVSGVTNIEYGFYTLPLSQYPYSPNPGPIDFQSQRWQVTSGPVRVTDSLNRVTNYGYCNPYVSDGCLVTHLQWFEDPEGIKTHLTQDGFGNVASARRVPKPSSAMNPVSDAILTSASYACFIPASCTKPAVLVDGNGNRSFFRYDETVGHGGITWREDGVPPGSASTPGWSNRLTPVKRYAYAQRTAQVSNGYGGTIPAATAIWLLAEERTCRTSRTVPLVPSGTPPVCEGGAADEVVTTYDYGPLTGPNTLLLRGIAVTADGQTRRTCYGYDRLGNRVSETKPLGTAALASCP